MKCVRFIFIVIVHVWPRNEPKFVLSPCTSSSLVRPHRGLLNNHSNLDLDLSTWILVENSQKYQSQNEPNQNKLKTLSTWISNKKMIKIKILKFSISNDNFSVKWFHVNQFEKGLVNFLFVPLVRRGGRFQHVGDVILNFSISVGPDLVQLVPLGHRLADFRPCIPAPNRKWAPIFFSRIFRLLSKSEIKFWSISKDF